MKIPRYQSRGSISTQAPGRSMTARMRAEPYVQQALAKGNVFGEAVSQVGQFAQMRYKMAREAQLSNALLGTQEQLAEEYNRLSKSEKPWGVLDGDDPEWNKTTESIRTKMRDSVGTDRSALQRFDETFSRQELQQRFRLRTVIDQKIEADTQATHRQYLQDKEDKAVDAETVQYLDLLLKEAGAESNKLSTVLDFDPVALQEQEYALLNNVAYRRLQKFVDESGKPLTKFSAIHKALRDDDLQELIDAGGDGLIEVELLKRLRPEDRAKILNSVGSTRQAIDGKTIEEENLLKTQEVFAKSAADDIEEATKAIIDGFDVSLADYNNIEKKVKQAIQILPPGEAKDITAGYENLAAITAARNEVRQMNPNQITKYINDLRAEGTETERQRNVISFLEDYQTKFQKRIDDTPYQVAQQNGLLAGKFKRINFDFSSEQSIGNVIQGLKIRNSLYREIDGVYNRTARGLLPKILDDGEVVQLNNVFDNMGFADQRNAIGAIQSALGKDAQHLFRQISKDAPLLGHIAGLMQQQGINSSAVSEIQTGMMAENKASLSSAVDGEGEILFSSYMQGAFSMLPERMAAQLNNTTRQAVEAIISARVLKQGLNVAEMDKEEFNSIISYALGGSKDGERGGVGVYNGRSYFRPLDASDEEFEEAIKTLDLQTINEMAKTTNLSSFDPRNENLQEILKEVTDQNYSVFVSRKDNRGRNVYGFLYGDVGNEQVVRSDTGLPVEFIYEEIQPAKQRIELLQTIKDVRKKEEIAQQEAEQAAQIDIELQNLTEEEKAQLELLSGSRLIDADIVDAKTWDKLQNSAYRTKMSGDIEYWLDVGTRKVYNSQTKKEVTGKLAEQVFETYKMSDANAVSIGWYEATEQFVDFVKAQGADINSITEEAVAAFLRSKGLKPKNKMVIERVLTSSKGILNRGSQ
jgi:hypothetical protein